MVTENIPQILEPVISVITEAVGIMQILLGGLFGLYLLLVILKWWESRKLVKIMKDIRADVREMKDHFVKKRSTRK